MNSIGLIISTYNWPAALDRVLASVVGQSVSPNEVLVADDGSGPDTAAVVAKWARQAPIPITHVWQADLGFRVARARNLALARSTADYLIFLDGDQVLDRHFVADHRRAARPGAVLRGSRAFLSPARTAAVLATGKLPGWWQSGIRKRPAAIRLPWLSALLGGWRGRHTEGHNIACWRADAVRINGFEERFEGWGGEDSEFVLRLLHAGLVKRRIRFGAVLYHLDHPPSARHLQRRNDRIYHETAERLRVRALVGLDELGSTTARQHDGTTAG